MDSRQSPQTLRGQDVMTAWSRIYRLEGYYIDLNLKASSHSAVLLGQILPVTRNLRGSCIDLKGMDGQILESTPIGSAGDFRCTLHPGVYQLDIRLADKVLSLPLEV